MAISRRILLPLALFFGVLGLVVAQLAIATHPRPKAATPLRVSLVPAFEQCLPENANRTHGPPLGAQSCSPPVQTSNFLTVGTFDANGAPSNSTGFVHLRVQPGSTDNLVLTASITDVRCKPGTAAGVCSSPNTSDGPDYSGELRGNATIRITDHFNAVNPGGGTDAATVVDLPFPFGLICARTADPSTGGVCNNTTGRSIARNGDRTVVEITQLQIFDGGADGNVFTQGNTLFMNQGVFIP